MARQMLLLLISKTYLVALIFSLLEYTIEIVLFPAVKDQQLGPCNACNWGCHQEDGNNNSWSVIHSSNKDSSLAASPGGIYGVVRHPGYCGFFIWSVGTQIRLCNPISTLAFALVVWLFFQRRIPYEEFYLRQFFGSQNEEYGRRVPSGVGSITVSSIECPFPLLGSF